MTRGDDWKKLIERLAREQGQDPANIEAGATLRSPGALGIVRGETTGGQPSLDVRNAGAAGGLVEETESAEDRFFALWRTWGDWEEFGDPRPQVTTVAGYDYASDFAWVRDGYKLLIVEIEGMMGKGGHVGAHRSVTGFQRDAWKYNAAQVQGWGGVFRIPSWWLERGYKGHTPRELIASINMLLTRRWMLVCALKAADTDEARALLEMMQFEEGDKNGTEA